LSSALSPEPTPNSARPPDRLASDAIAEALTAGCLVTGLLTAGSSRRRAVRIAQAAMVT
jgi:hypothetical protein